VIGACLAREEVEMLTITCKLGLDAEDAALNRPALVLRPPEVDDIQALLAGRHAPTLTTLLNPDDSPLRALGIWTILALRGELQTILSSIAARQLPDQLVPALTLQRLDIACCTAQEFGLNLYVTAERE
jgi:hypothetical protein